MQTDIAHCQSCGFVFRISEYLTSDDNDEFDIDHPPPGAWIRRGMHELVIGATTRHPIAFFLVPFMIIWSGGALGGIYGSQIFSGEFNPLMSLFGIPFILGSIIFWSFALMAVAGKVEVTLYDDGGTIFTGVGGIGITKRFTWDEISTVKERYTNFRYPGSYGTALLLEGKRRITLGGALNEARRYYVLKAIQQVLLKKNLGKAFL